MIKINKIRIENFQSHEDTVIEFDYGLNVIVGPSDYGKSSIVRAIKWVLYNEPRGFEFIRQGAQIARVTLELNNGCTIIRERAQNKNRYIIVDDSGKQTVFEGFGSEIPEEVIKAHCIPQVILDSNIKSGLNIADQLESPFLISQTGAVRAKAIGRLIGLHIIDKSIKDTLLDIKRENQFVERIKTELDDIDEGLEKFKRLDLIEERLLDFGVLLGQIKNLVDKKDKIELLNVQNGVCDTDLCNVRHSIYKLRDIDKCGLFVSKCELKFIKLRRLEDLKSKFLVTRADIAVSNEAIDKTANNDSCENIVRDITAKHYAYTKLKRLNERLMSLSKEISICENFLDKVSEVGKIEAFVTDKILFKIEKAKRFETIFRNYSDINKSLAEGKKYLNDNEAEIRSLLTEYVKVLKDKRRCPLCDSEISENVVENIIRNYEEGF